MEIEYFKSLIVLISGAAIPMIITYFNNKYQTQRDIRKYEYDIKVEREKREFEEAKNYRDSQLKYIEEVSKIIYLFEHSISLTASVIDSSNNLKPEEFDIVHRKELKQLRILKSMILARFPDYYDTIEVIAGHYNN